MMADVQLMLPTRGNLTAERFGIDSQIANSKKTSMQDFFYPKKISERSLFRNLWGH